MNIKKLIKLSNEMDKDGLFKEADYLDYIISKIAFVESQSVSDLEPALDNVPTITPASESDSDLPIPSPSEFALNKEDFSFLGDMLKVDPSKAGRWFAKELEEMIDSDVMTVEQAMTFLNEIQDDLAISETNVEQDDSPLELGEETVFVEDMA